MRKLGVGARTGFLVAAVFVATLPAAAEEQTAPASAVKPSDCVASAEIGVATMTPDGVITLRLRSLPPGPIAEGVLTYKPDDPHYGEIKQHLGGIAPGETKPVKAWC
jgi:hypothetical protein